MSVQGSIPVCTGLPPPRKNGVTGRRVYPRVYGATCKDANTSAWKRGLSPCVRGYHAADTLSDLGLGSIPVCTGLPAEGRRAACAKRVYPRVYGATRRKRDGLRAARGLSPCVRGYQRLIREYCSERGSIPVCTGLPHATSIRPPLRWVYPRVYGATPATKCHRSGMEGAFSFLLPFFCVTLSQGGWAAARYVLAHHYLK